MMRAHLLAQLDREAPRSRKVLAELPDGNGDWKPHEKSMALEYLANLVAVMPTWIALQTNRNELDLAPKDGPSITYEKKTTSAQYVSALDAAVDQARAALEATTDEHLATMWQLKVRGAVVQEDARVIMIQDTISHWSHHRGQLTVYLRLLNRRVPSTFGPSADEQVF